MFKMRPQDLARIQALDTLLLCGRIFVVASTPQGLLSEMLSSNTCHTQQLIHS